MFNRVWIIIITLWVGGSQVYGEVGRGGGEGVLPAGTQWEQEQEMAGEHGQRAFRPAGGGGGRRRRWRRSRRGRWIRRMLGLLKEWRAAQRAAAAQEVAPAGERSRLRGPEWERERRLPPVGWGSREEPTRNCGSPLYTAFRQQVGRPQGIPVMRAPRLVGIQVQLGVHPLQQFRAELYDLLRARPDAVLDLLDALCGSPWARSVVELSLSPLFRRAWGSLPDAIDAFFQAAGPDPVARQALAEQLARLIGSYLPPPQQRKFWLLGTDVVPVPRPYAQTLEDRSFVHVATPVGGVTPVGIGHQYSVVALLPEKGQAGDPAWVVPLGVRRVPSDEKATTVGAEQVVGLLEDRQQPFAGELCVQVADSNYSHANFLGRVGALPNAVQVVRSACNRVFYRALPAPVGKAPAGHPTWYGDRFDLKDTTTWGTPDEETTTTWTTKRGRLHQVQIQAWTNLLMRGKRGLPMHRYPFTLIRGEVRDAQGKLVFQRPLWLIVLGNRRGELTLLDAWESYRQRFDLEHYFRFGKQRLLLASYQTPVGEHEENWLMLVQLATVQLWLGRDLAGVRLRPWEKYLPVGPTPAATPSQVQRDWERIIRLIGTPASGPQPRGKSPGRSPGASPGRRPRLAVVKKTSRKGTPPPL